MLKKILLLAVAVVFSSSLWADDAISITECEAKYSYGLEKCDTLDESKQEECFDKIEEDYSKCLEKVNAE